ncbi:hypothetical protein HNP36_001837 [Chryseobacterium shigense]|uniref:Uncharacterized protein n=1 Tax=Chryseobacterium shigense TaxID=297244 RepID=A0A841N1P8_9FLAO|nr:hypothetical protein [Chryseobacterium shigense]
MMFKHEKFNRRLPGFTQTFKLDFIVRNNNLNN